MGRIPSSSSEKVSGAKLLPIPYGEGFTDHDDATTPDYYKVDEEGIDFEIKEGDTLGILIAKSGAKCHVEAPVYAAATSSYKGTYFPTIKGISIPEIQKAQHTDFAPYRLSSALETAAALVARPDLLRNSNAYAPILWCAKEADETHGYYFEQYGDTLTFNRRPHLGLKSDYWWAGVVK